MKKREHGLQHRRARGRLWDCHFDCSSYIDVPKECRVARLGKIRKHEESVSSESVGEDVLAVQQEQTDAALVGVPV